MVGISLYICIRECVCMIYIYVCVCVDMLSRSIYVYVKRECVLGVCVYVFRYICVRVSVYVAYLSIYIYIYMYIHIYIYIYTHTHTHTHTYIYIYIYIYACMFGRSRIICTGPCTKRHMCEKTSTLAYTLTHMFIHKGYTSKILHTNLQAHTEKSSETYNNDEHKLTCIYIYIYIYIYICNRYIIIIHICGRHIYIYIYMPHTHTIFACKDLTPALDSTCSLLQGYRWRHFSVIITTVSALKHNLSVFRINN